MFDIVTAIEFLHKNNICHKDMSLQNVCMKDDEAKIIDFGLAECFESSQCWSNRKVGKSNFASPKCYNPDVPTFDAKANDVWTLGVIMFMCLTKIAPFKNPLDRDAQRIQQGRRNIHRMLRDYKK